MTRLTMIDIATAQAEERLRRVREQLGDITVGEITEELQEDLERAFSGDLRAFQALTGKVARERELNAQKQAYSDE